MRLVELASGVDALYLSGAGAIRAQLFEELGDAKAQAQELGELLPYAVGGIEFGLASYGWGKYAYRLEHPNALIGLTASEHLPAVRVQPRASFLHGVGVGPALEWIEQVVSAVVDGLRLSVSRLDLFADVQGWVPTLADRHRFVTRAGAIDMHERQERFTGFEFGRRTGGGLVGRIYDKTVDIETKGSRWWLEMWGEDHREDEPVFRVEFEFGRMVLRQFAVRTPEETLAGKGDLWSYATEWLSHRSPTADGTRSRWPVSDEWEFVRSVSLCGGSIGLQRVRKAAGEASLRRLLPALSGYSASVAALLGVETIPALMPHLEWALGVYEDMKGISFSSRVRDKMNRSRWS